MREPRKESPLREQARGVGLVVALGAVVCLVGLAVITLFVWVVP